MRFIMRPSFKGNARADAERVFGSIIPWEGQLRQIRAQGAYTLGGAPGRERQGSARSLFFQ
jgi:hypothetical protein